MRERVLIPMPQTCTTPLQTLLNHRRLEGVTAHCARLNSEFKDWYPRLTPEAALDLYEAHDPDLGRLEILIEAYNLGPQ